MQAALTNPASRNSILFLLIAILSIAGIVLSAISLQRHYAKSATNFCDFSQKFSCDIVNRSEYSEIQGIPIAGIGMVGYAVLFALSTYWRSRQETPARLLVTALAGLGFALYLTYIEAYVLTTWCILCVGSLVMISVISLLSILVKARTRSA